MDGAAAGAYPGAPMAPEQQMALLERIVRADPDLMRLLETVRPLALPQWRLVAGCLYQTVWNALTGRPQGTGIKDFDLIYFDASDLSWEAEDRVIRRVDRVATGFPASVEVRNQARVHLWFEDHFGSPYAPLASADEALERYTSVVHALGVRLEPDGRLDLAAPFGLDDLFSMTIRPNHATACRASYDAKATRALSIWPEVTVLPWDAG